MKPIITRFVTYSGYCVSCHRGCDSRHPDQTSDAIGAAGFLVGPRPKPCYRPQYRLGIPYGKVSEVLNDAFGLPVSRSGWCKADQKLSETARPVYEKLIEFVRLCCVVHADDMVGVGTLSVRFLEANGIACTKINKVLEGLPDIVHSTKNREVDLVFNTTEGAKALADSSTIRRTALMYKIPVLYNHRRGARRCRSHQSNASRHP